MVTFGTETPPYMWLLSSTPAAIVICLYALDKSNFVSDSPLASAAKTSSEVGRGYVSTFKCGLMVTLKSAQIHSFLSFLVTTTIGVAQLLWSTCTSSPSATCCCRVCSTWLHRLNGIGRDLQNLLAGVQSLPLFPSTFLILPKIHLGIFL